MARALRVNRSEIWYHLTARGIERRAIFRDDRDRRHFLELLADTPKRFGVRCHAYVLMDNHYHLLLETPLANLSQAMQWINVSYSVWFNRRHTRAGPLFQGRFKAIVVDPPGWGLSISRYLHLNPVRVGSLGLSKAAQKRKRQGLDVPPDREQIQNRLDKLTRYRWSSYRAYIGAETAPQWLSCGSVLELIGTGAAQQRARGYRNYVEEALREGLQDSPWDNLAGRLVLGSQALVQSIRKTLRGNIKEQPALRAMQALPTWPQVVRALEDIKGEPWLDFRDRHGDWGRDLALYLGRTRCGLRLAELGELAGGLDYRTVGWIVTRFARRIAQNKQIRKCLEHAQKHVQNPET